VLCPGGMMSAAVSEVMAAAGALWPQAHRDASAMARLALAMHEATGFDNIAVPFCMTVEAEAFGARVDLGTLLSQPRVRGAILPPDGSGELPSPDLSKGGAVVLLEAIRLLRASRPDLPVIGNLVGPFSLLGMLADPLRVLRWCRRDPSCVARYLDALTDCLVDFGHRQVSSGADVICLAEPTATGEILGSGLFESLVAPRLTKIAHCLAAFGVPSILHICGDASAIRPQLIPLPFSAVSFDSMVDIVALAAARPPWAVMGNISPFLLETGPEDAVKDVCLRLLDGGIRLLAPGCGITPATPLAHLRAMGDALASRGDGGT